VGLTGAKNFSMAECHRIFVSSKQTTTNKTQTQTQTKSLIAKKDKQ